MKVFEQVQTNDVEAPVEALNKPLESGCYDATIDMVYSDTTKSGLTYLAVTFLLSTGRKIRQDIYPTNGKGEMFYTKDGKKLPLAGFTLADELSVITSGKKLTQAEATEATIKVYDYDVKDEVLARKAVFKEMLGKPVKVLLVQTKFNKQTKDATGSYVDIAESYEKLVLDKILYESGKTVTESQKGLTEPAYMNSWCQLNSGKVKDRRKIKEGTSAATNNTDTSLFS